MESLLVLIPISLIVAIVIGGLFWWSSQNGQFDDLEGPAHRILMDDDAPQSGEDSDNTTPKTPTS